VRDVEVAFGECGLVGLLGDHGQQYVGSDVAPEGPGGLLQFRIEAPRSSSEVVLAAQKAEVCVLGREPHPRSDWPAQMMGIFRDGIG